MKILKMSAVLAVTAVACSMMIGTGEKSTSVSASEGVIKRRPVIESIDEKTGKQKIQYMDTGYFRGVTWDEENKVLTLENFDTVGDIHLDYFDESKYSEEEIKNERHSHLTSEITVKVKGDLKLGTNMYCDCILNIEGDGANARMCTNSYIAKRNANRESCKINALVSEKIKNIKLNNVCFESIEITFDNVVVDKTFRPEIYDLDKNGSLDERNYEEFAIASSQVRILNSNMTMKYSGATKSQLKFPDEEYSYCFKANRMIVSNSTVDFTGNEAFKKTKIIGIDGRNRFANVNSNINYKLGQYAIDKKHIYRITNIGDNKEVEYVENIKENASTPKSGEKVFLLGYYFNIR